MLRVFIIRHGETSDTERKINHGVKDTPLCAKGKRQAKKLKRQFKSVSIDYIYTSPLTRCKETAGIIRGRRNIPLQAERDIREIDFGEWEGMKLCQMRRHNPEKFECWMNDFVNLCMPKGESVRGLIKRTKNFWRRIIKKHKKGNIVVVTHGGPARIMLMDSLKIPKREFWRIQIDTCSVNIVEIQNGTLMVKTINSCPPRRWTKIFKKRRVGR